MSGVNMQNEVKKIITSMDIHQDREDAESKAIAIFKLGPEALNMLVDLGKTVNEKETDAVKKKKLLRAVILAIEVFARKRIFLTPRIFSNSNAISLLCELSSEGYHSAGMVLHNIGFSDSDIQKERLLSLPIVDKHLNDEEISVNEALQEIKTAVLSSHLNTIKNNAYLIGYSKKHAHEIYRIGKKDFACRIRRH